MLIRKREFPSGSGVHVGAAPGSEEHGCGRVAALEFELRAAGIIAVPLEKRQGRGVAGVRNQERLQLAAGIADREYRHPRIERSLEFSRRPQSGCILLGVLAAIETKVRC